MSVFYQNNVWEGNFNYFIMNNGYKNSLKKLNYNFDKKFLTVNYVSNRLEVSNKLDSLIKEGYLDEYYFVCDYEQKALNFFNLKKQDFFKNNIDGYYYSIQNLVGLYLFNSDYLFVSTTDSVFSNDNFSEFVSNSIDEFNKNDKIITACPKWTNDINHILNETKKETDNFYYSNYFSDQFFLAKTKEFKKDIYQCKNNLSDRFAREMFEKKVDSYMINNNYYRIIHKKSNYINQNL